MIIPLTVNQKMGSAALGSLLLLSDSAPSDVSSAAAMSQQQQLVSVAPSSLQSPYQGDFLSGKSPLPFGFDSFLMVSTPDDQPKILRQCAADTNCVSSNFKEPPNRYLSPLKIVKDQDKAFQQAVRDLNEYSKEVNELSIAEIDPKNYYIRLTVPGTAPNSLDDIELWFTDAGIVNLRAQARVTLPPPPFCIQKGCINGNMDQRTRVERISKILGLPSMDRERMQQAKWTPIFFNSDRVPGFDEYE